MWAPEAVLLPYLWQRKYLMGVFLATDMSLEALNVARYNTRQHHLTDRIGFLQGDLFAPLSPQKARFHVIISNPPYVCTHEFQGLLPEVADYEPRLALDGGKDGMTFLKTIISEGHLFLRACDGWLLLEMAPAQVDQALSRLVQCGFYKKPNRYRGLQPSPKGHSGAGQPKKPIPIRFTLQYEEVRP